jgi:hypothetical protein
MHCRDIRLGYFALQTRDAPLVTRNQDAQTQLLHIEVTNLVINLNAYVQSIAVVCLRSIRSRLLLTLEVLSLLPLPVGTNIKSADVIVVIPNVRQDAGAIDVIKYLLKRLYLLVYVILLTLQIVHLSIEPANLAL